MRILIAMDKFKECLSAQEACAAVAAGIAQAHPDWVTETCPLADGGDGFARILTDAAGGEWCTARVAGPLGAPVDAGFGLVRADRLNDAVRARFAADGFCPGGGDRLAVIEMAAASGLALVNAGERDVWRSHTGGTGELIAAAVARGAAGVLLGVGGSATHDLGLGALGALGAVFENGEGNRVALPVPAVWAEIARMDVTGMLKMPPVFIACDVTNPLLGQRGAAAVYAPQKGLNAEDFQRMETEGSRMARLLCAACGRNGSLTDIAGAGAAGGLAFGLMAGAGARLVPGFDLVSEWLALEERLARADVVVTGEGRFDDSSLQGKGPGALVRAALAAGKPVHVFAGRVDATAGAGLALHEITPRDVPLVRAMAEAGERLRACAEGVFARA